MLMICGFFFPRRLKIRTPPHTMGCPKLSFFHPTFLNQELLIEKTIGLIEIARSPMRVVHQNALTLFDVKMFGYREG